MADLATAYVQILPTTKGLKRELTAQMGGEVSSAGDSAGISFGSSMVSKIKGIVAAAGIGTMFKEAISAGADLEQSFGGLETIYGDAADAAKAYAREAAAAGISANDYAEQAVSFGASLKMAFSGDTAKAVEAANTAIMDMTDNAAKMGTPLESIQNAYSGFAKQNYTMLDNLKLGYGGTKEEMQRLLEDAQKISGVKYDLSNLGDVYDAIHVIQGELGLTGVAAEEASTTLSGSMGAMKSAFQNLLAEITTGGDVVMAFYTFNNNIRTFITDNMLPMIGNALSALPTVIDGAFTSVILTVNSIMQKNPDIIKNGAQLVLDIGRTIVANMPYLLESVLSIGEFIATSLAETDWMSLLSDFISSFKDSMELGFGEAWGVDTFGEFIDELVASINELLPRLVESGASMLRSIGEGLSTAIPALLENVLPMIMELTGTIRENFGVLVDAGIDMLVNIADGIIAGLPTMIKTIPTIISNICGLVNDNMPKILKAGIEILVNLVKGIVESIPVIIQELPKIVGAIIDFISAVNWLDLGVKVVTGISSGIGSMVSNLGETAKNLAKSAWEAIKNHDWLGLGKNIIDGILSGLKNAASKLLNYLKDLCKSMLSSVKDFFQISSPSKVMRDQVGKWIPEGIGIGIINNEDAVVSAMDDLSDATTKSMSGIQLGTVAASSSLAKGSGARVASSGSADILTKLTEALSSVSVTMDGRAVGMLVAAPVNDAMGRISQRRV